MASIKPRAKIGEPGARVAVVAILRAIGAIVRLATIYSLGYALGLELLSQALLIITIISTLPLFVSLEFHVPSLRNAKRSAIAGDNTVFGLALFGNIVVALIGSALIFFPLAIFLETSQYEFTKHQIVLCAIVVILDAVIQEIQRLLAVREEQTLASVVFVAKQFQLLLSLAAGVALMQIRGSSYLDWFFATYISLSIAILLFLGTKKSRAVFGVPRFRNLTPRVVVDWLANNTRSTVSFFFAGLFGKLTFGYERLFIGLFFSKDVFAQYVYVMLIVGGVAAFIEPLINHFSYPKLLRHVAAHEMQKVRRLAVRSLLPLTLLSAVTIVALLMHQHTSPAEYLRLTSSQLIAFTAFTIFLYANILLQPFLTATNLDRLIRNSNLIVFLSMYCLIILRPLTLDNVLLATTTAQLIGLILRISWVTRTWRKK